INAVKGVVETFQVESHIHVAVLVNPGGHDPEVVLEEGRGDLRHAGRDRSGKWRAAAPCRPPAGSVKHCRSQVFPLQIAGPAVTLACPMRHYPSQWRDYGNFVT